MAGQVSSQAPQGSRPGSTQEESRSMADKARRRLPLPELRVRRTLYRLGSKPPAKPFRAARFSRFRSGSMWGDSSVGEQ